MATFLPASPHTHAREHPPGVPWLSGGCSTINDTPQLVGEQLAESMNLRLGARVLDVAAGSGNTTLSFARRWHRVVSTDRAPASLGFAAARARAEGLDVEFLIAGPDRLPFADGGFDAVVSTFGVMHTPDQRATAAELVRVCRPGGTIGLSTWAPDSFIGHLYRVISRGCAGPAEAEPSMLWGDRPWLTETFRGDVSELRITPGSFVLRYRDPAHFIESVRAVDGPVQRAFRGADGLGCRGLTSEIGELVARFNMVTDGTMAIRAEYLRVLLRRRSGADASGRGA